MNKTIPVGFAPFASPCLCSALLACALGLAAGCVETGGYGRDAGKGETELRGVLVLAATNAPDGLVAVLESRGGTRPPCSLRTSGAGVADDIRTLAARGVVVVVTGVPGPQMFTVSAVREDGRTRRIAHDEEVAPAGKAGGFWSGVSWGSVPAQEK